MGFMCATEHYSALKNKGILPFATIGMALEGIMLSSVSDREGQILYGLTCMGNPKKSKRNGTEQKVELQKAEVEGSSLGLG